MDVQQSGHSFYTCHKRAGAGHTATPNSPAIRTRIETSPESTQTDSRVKPNKNNWQRASKMAMATQNKYVWTHSPTKHTTITYLSKWMAISMPFRVVIIISKLLKHHSKARHRAPAYLRAPHQVRTWETGDTFTIMSNDKVLTRDVNTVFLANLFSVVENRFSILLAFIEISVPSPVKSCTIWFL